MKSDARAPACRLARLARLAPWILVLSSTALAAGAVALPADPVSPGIYVPGVHSEPLLDGEDPVQAYLAFSARELARVRSDRRFAAVGRTAEELHRHLARAERDGDWESFAAGLDVPSEAHDAWAATMLLPLVSRDLNARVLALSERRLGLHGDLSRVARAAMGVRRTGLSLATVRLGANAGFFLADGTCLMRIRKTRSGWRVTAATKDEREAQPARNLPAMLVDLAAWECALELMPPEGPLPATFDGRALLARIEERLTAVQARIASRPREGR